MIDASQVHYDAKGLVPAVLVDAETSDVLMVAWMNAESLEVTLRTRLATFWSRSRSELWTKGLTSGNFMHVVDITADCDADTLLVRVRPDGPACHTGARSCFFTPVSGLADEDDARRAARRLVGRAAQYAPISKAAVSSDSLSRVTSDWHMHTTWSDGRATPREMIRSALAAGLTEIGITDHAHTAFDESYCMAADAYARYREEIGTLAAQFAGKITIHCGVEQDFFSDISTAAFDYAIGSVHYVRVPGAQSATVITLDNPDGEYLPVDESPAILRLGIDKYFDGDALALAEAYYALVGQVVERTHCAVVGHFDLIKLFNRGNAFFAEDDPRYRAAWQKAADELLDYGIPFEINVNGVAKGRCDEPYPSLEIVRYLAQRGAMFVVDSDAHRPDFLHLASARPELACYLGA